MVAADIEGFPTLRTVAAGNDSALKSALDGGAGVNATDRYGRTALMIAAGLERADLVKALLAQGADSTLCDNAGHTARDYARSAEQQPLFQNKNGLLSSVGKVQDHSTQTLEKIDRMKGAKRVLFYFAPGGDQAQKIARQMSKNRDFWCDTLGAALLAREVDPASSVKTALDMPDADDSKRGRLLVAFLSQAKSTDSKALKRLWPAFDDTHTNEETARWKGFLRLIDRGKNRQAEQLTIDPDYSGLVKDAVDRLRQAGTFLPGWKGNEEVIAALPPSANQ